MNGLSCLIVSQFRDFYSKILKSNRNKDMRYLSMLQHQSIHDINEHKTQLIAVIRLTI